MFLAAAPYFQQRFSTSDWLLTHFQSGILTVSTITNLGAMLLLTKLQENASYPRRIIASLVLNLGIFTLLALSAVLFQDISPNAYYGFVLVMVFSSSFASALCQNGLFAFVAGFGVGEYTQAIMTGQAVAGVLPCIVQIVAALSIPENGATNGAGEESPKSAFIYFMTATAVSAIALVAFIHLARRHPEHTTVKAIGEDLELNDEEPVERKVVGLMTLFLKLKWFSLGVAVTFAVTMMYPVFTQSILSVRPAESASRLFQPACFIPLAFLVWNVGDLIGRTLPLLPALNFTQRPRLVFTASLARLVWIPLYLLCNIRGKGAAIESDFFYLVIVQLLFGITNGFLGSTCMMAAPEWVDATEREAAGGFMGLCLVFGLTVGSLLSFLAAGA